MVLHVPRLFALGGSKLDIEISSSAQSEDPLFTLSLRGSALVALSTGHTEPGSFGTWLPLEPFAEATNQRLVAGNAAFIQLHLSRHRSPDKHFELRIPAAKNLAKLDLFGTKRFL